MILLSDPLSTEKSNGFIVITMFLGSDFEVMFEVAAVGPELSVDVVILRMIGDNRYRETGHGKV